MPRAAISVATSTRTVPALNSFSAFSRWFCERFECSVPHLMPACSSRRAILSAPCFVREKTSTLSIFSSCKRCTSRAGFRWPEISYTNCVTVSAGFERRPICTVFGCCWNSCVSASISFESVAENMRVCRFTGSLRITRRMLGRKPMSSIRSASSSTRCCRPEKSPLRRSMRSRRRPGHAMMMSTPERNALICGFSPTPPKTVAIVNGRCFA